MNKPSLALTAIAGALANISASLGMGRQLNTNNMGSHLRGRRKAFLNPVRIHRGRPGDLLNIGGKFYVVRKDGSNLRVIKRETKEGKVQLLKYRELKRAGYFKKRSKKILPESAIHSI